MKLHTSIIALLFGIFMSCSDSDSGQNITENDDPTDDTSMSDDDSDAIGVMRDISSFELVTDMESGWNLGNSLDAEGNDETAFGNPVVTKSLIDAVKARGFGTLRVPVTWRFQTGGAPNYTIEESWLNRVEEVVNYGLDNDMYVIINIHHDEQWIIPTYEQSDAVKDRLEKNWTQIAEHFKDYSDYLIFETLNEPRYEGQPQEWTGTPEWIDVVNQYHKTSLDAIRATGGNNSVRHIMISSYAAAQGTMFDLEIPNDDPNTIVSLHNYFPFQFSLANQDQTWGTQQDKDEMDGTFDQIENLFIANGTPVIMGEWGSSHQDNTADRLEHATYYAEALAERQILPIVWDNGNPEEFGLINRNTLQWEFPNIADAIINSGN